jgi:CRISPR-associated protein Csd1
LIDQVCADSRDDGVIAVKSFLAKWNPTDSTALRDWKEMSGMHGKWVAFRLQSDALFIHERPELKKLWTAFVAGKEFQQGVSFVDGKVHDLQPQYAQFKFGSGSYEPSDGDLLEYTEAASYHLTHWDKKR